MEKVDNFYLLCYNNFKQIKNIGKELLPMYSYNVTEEKHLKNYKEYIYHEKQIFSIIAVHCVTAYIFT